ncbi:MAG: hypothetical protein M1828_005246 [Chrysothrix sp. TS-e1954]|nr:MAG: hypothetical protein M1828_005246 [Chrysothrix sp. TS-e1954]
MAWDHLAVDKPHLVYIILGGFTSIFMLVSSIIKEKLYIGEATIAVLCGIAFGPHAADLIDPSTWGNTDKITLEFSRIVLVVQCFAVGVELPRAYMERHWRSVVFLLIPVMTFGWLMTSLFIWGLLGSHLNWLDSLVCAACVTATDPVLASAVVGKGKFAKRVPKHLRDLLSAESGCNDGMAFPFIYLGIYLTQYRPNAGEVILNWACITILYECIFGAIYGFVIGYIARRAIRLAHEHDLIDRESFLVFYFVLALFCAGSGSMLGMDDLLIGFSAGVGFSNDGWFLEKTEEAHVSNVIDLLINLAFFVYFGTIIPWETYNSDIIGTSPWRLVIIGLLVLFFRRIPIMLLLKPVIPDIKTWREALFAGHFGPIGVGALFVAILARAEFETDSTSPLAKLPPPGFEHRNIIELIWPITTFLVITSILVHGSSIAVFTLGKHINTLTITMSYTQANEEGNWMDRLPRIASRSKSSMSNGKLDSDESLDEEKMPEYPAATLDLPSNFLKRQAEEDTPNRLRKPHHRRGKNSRFGGPISQSAISPVYRESPQFEKSESETLAAKSSDESRDSSDESPGGGKRRSQEHEHERDEEDEELFEEGDDAVIEDREGNVLEVMESNKRPGESEAERQDEEEHEAKRLAGESESQRYGDESEGRKHIEGPKEAMHDYAEGVKKLTGAGKVSRPWKGMKSRMGSWAPKRTDTGSEASAPARRDSGFPANDRRHAPARAFRFGRTIIVEDEDGEVIKKYEIPQRERGEGERRTAYSNYIDPEKTRQRMQRMGQWMGVGGNREDGEPSGDAEGQTSRKGRKNSAAIDDDIGIRFTMNGTDRRMSKAEFIKQIQGLDPTSRAEVVEESNAPEPVKEEARAEAEEHEQGERRASAQAGMPGAGGRRPSAQANESAAGGRRPSAQTNQLAASGRRPSAQAGQSAAGGRRSSVQAGKQDIAISHDNTESAEIHKVTSNEGRPSSKDNTTLVDSQDQDIPIHPIHEDLQYHRTGQETAAERRRRLAQMTAARDDEDSDDDGTERVTPSQRRAQGAAKRTSPGPSIKPEPGETAAERRRREGALGLTKEESDSDEDESRPREPPKHAVPGGQDLPPQAGPSIRFADQPARAGGPSVKFQTAGKGKGRK